MIIKNIKIVTLNKVIENGYIEIKDGLISNIVSGEYQGNEEAARRAVHRRSPQGAHCCC